MIAGRSAEGRDGHTENTRDYMAGRNTEVNKEDGEEGKVETGGKTKGRRRQIKKS